MAFGEGGRVDLQALLAQIEERGRQEEECHRRWKEQQEARQAEHEAHMERLEALLAQQQATPPLRRIDLETTLDQVHTLALPRSRCTVGLLSLPRTQRGSVSQRLAKVCGLAPSPRHDQRVSRPAASRAHGEPPGAGWARRPVARGETGTL